MRVRGRFFGLLLIGLLFGLMACGDTPTVVSSAISPIVPTSTTGATTAPSGVGTATAGTTAIAALPTATAADATTAPSVDATIAATATPSVSPDASGAGTTTPPPAPTGALDTAPANSVAKPTNTPFRGPTVTIAPRPTQPAGNPTSPPAAAGAPVKVIIPEIGVNAAIEYVGVDKNNNMGTPNNPWNVAWYNRGPFPGKAGNAVLAGHVDWWTTGPAVFWDLRKLKIGSVIQVVDNQNATRTFVVNDIKAYNDTNAPLTRIFGPADSANLNLITCTGDFDRASGHYNQRLVVYATLRQ